MSYGALILLAAVAVTGTPLTAPPDARYIWALLYLAVFGSVLGFAAYLSLVARIGPAKAAYTTVFFPVVALAVSTFVENYHWTRLGVAGVVLTMIGNAVMFWTPRPRPAAARG
jgi:drug/metabolite transporter (DMT)-like permease